MHPHTLELEFSPPYGNAKGFRCDICGIPGSDHWLYRCSRCEFDVHLRCARADTPNQQPQFHNRSTPPIPASPPPVPPADNSVRAIAPQANQCATYGNQNQSTQLNGSNMNQHQAQNPMNNSYVMSSSTNATPHVPSGIYANPSNVIPPGGAYVNYPTGNYGFNQGGYVHQQGGMGMVPVGNPVMGYSNQPGLGVSHGALGAGMGGLIAVGVVTGMGEAVGQGLVHSITDGFGYDGQGHSDQNV